MLHSGRRPNSELVSVSRIESDGTIVETIYRPDRDETGFAIGTPKGCRIESRWQCGRHAFVPVKPSNNLLKHQAMLLPSEATPYGSLDNLVDEIGLYLARYVRLTDAARALCIGYVLLSWVYDAFNEVPYLRFRGDYGTGKTRALLVVGAICYKAFFASGASTVSPIFHTLDTFRGSLIFDEADFRFSDEKAELVKILNNGNVRGFPVLRTQVTPSKEFDPRAFSIFGPKIVGMRRSYEDRALESRFLTIEMEPGVAQDVPISLPEDQKLEALDLRNKLLTYRMRTRMQAALDPSLAVAEFEPRMNQVLLPLLSVAPSGRMRAAIRSCAAQTQATIVADRAVSAEGDLVGIVSKLASQGLRPISVGAITAAFIEEHGSDYQRPIANRWIGTLLRRIGFGLYKTNGVFAIVPGQEDRLDVLCARYGVERPASIVQSDPQGDREEGRADRAGS